MATQDTTNNQDFFSDLQHHSAIQDARISNLETKFEMFMGEMRDFKQEMRQQNEMRRAEIAEIRNDIKEIYKTTDAKIDSINKSIASMQNQNIFVIIGVIAIAVAVFLK